MKANCTYICRYCDTPTENSSETCVLCLNELADAAKLPRPEAFRRDICGPRGRPRVFPREMTKAERKANRYAGVMSPAQVATLDAQTEAAR